jgi:hypothetical protein
LLIIAGAVLVLVLNIAGVFGAKTATFPLGCRLASVDKGEFVLANHKVLEDVPVYPGSKLISETTSGFSVAGDRCLPMENSGPYDSFATSRRYDMPVYARYEQVEAFYRNQLTARGWTLGWHSGPEQQYRKGEASLLVRGSSRWWGLVALYKYD